MAVLLAASAGAAPPEPAPPEGPPKYHALVVGIDHYREMDDGSGWASLRNARRDAEAVGALLLTQYGFQVRTLLDSEATRANLIRAFDELVHLSPNDAMLVYFSGHGYYDSELGEGFWIPADARRTEGGRPVTEEWVWNSTLTKIVGASRARHVLVVADACYGGSLFRGGEEILARRRFEWYRRANDRPSRYLLTSGNLEPVLDSGARHSVFAQQILNYLAHPEEDIFSASDLGRAVRTQVSALTGQMVRMGPLKVASHAGGEFIFLRDGAALPSGGGRGLPHPSTPEPAAAASPAQERPLLDILGDAVLLKERGAEASAQSVVQPLADAGDPGGLVETVARYVRTPDATQPYDQLDGLIRRLEERQDAIQDPDWLSAEVARPRILVCAGPEPQSTRADDHARALLYRVCLYEELRNHPGTRIVDRKALDDVIREMRIGTSLLAEENARLTVGRMLPASLLLVGSLVPSGDGEGLYLRLVDTESTEVLDTFWLSAEKDQSVLDLCREAGNRIAARAASARPLSVQVRSADADTLRAGIGRFHGARTGMTFRILERIPRAAGEASSGFDERDVGTAEVAELGESDSTFRARWSSASTTDPAGTFWIREQPNEARP
jgi:hypothetical protein